MLRSLFRREPREVAVRGTVAGRVQSVAFRFHARQEATQLRLSGWARNLGDGRVEFLVQGPEDRVEEWLRWVAVGPPRARVDAVEREAAEPEPLEGFEIR